MNLGMAGGGIIGGGHGEFSAAECFVLASQLDPELPEPAIELGQ